MRPTRTMRGAPTCWATEIIAVINTVGMPALSISLAIVAPLRVPVPQVAGEMTAFTPASNSSLAISCPYLWEASMPVPLPTVT